MLQGWGVERRGTVGGAAYFSGVTRVKISRSRPKTVLRKTVLPSQLPIPFAYEARLKRSFVIRKRQFCYTNEAASY